MSGFADRALRTGRRDAAVACRPRAATAAAGMPRYLGRAAPPLTVQRDGDGSTPPFQLKPPSLLQPSDSLARFRIGIGEPLRLDPDLRARVLARAREQLQPQRLIDPMAAAAAAAAAANGGATEPRQAAALPATQPAAPSQPAKPLDPDFVKTQRPATGGDAFGALTRLPQVTGLIDRVRDDALGRLARDWSASSTGENAAFVGSSVLVAGSLLTGVLGMKASRGLVYSLLNDTVIPIPKVDGLSIEFHVAGDKLQVGAQLDLGRFVPSTWGFGAGSPKSIDDPSWRALPPQIDREADGAACGTGAAAVADGIAAQQGRGRALDAALRQRFEPALGGDLSRVRLHTGTAADALARGVSARAFATGHDIFFRAGRYAPQSAAGQRLLAHELVHTLQQAAAPTATPAAGTALHVSEPGDRHEREAQRLAEHAVLGDGSAGRSAGLTAGV